MELLQRAASKVDQAAVYHLKMQLHVVKSENPQAVASALTCLRLFGIDLPAAPDLGAGPGRNTTRSGATWRGARSRA